VENWYYDNQPELQPDNTGTVSFERIYCLRFYDFTPENWQELARIYDQLPGKRYEKGVPYWFGDNESKSPHLWASVEPSGLQVAGLLPLADWQQWDEAFRQQIEASSLPISEL
jgi:hypothetical protein